MRYRLPVVITPLGDGEYMAECGPVRAVATGDTLEEAVSNLKEAVEEMVRQFGEEKVFEDGKPEADLQVRVLEVAVRENFRSWRTGRWSGFYGSSANRVR